MIGYLIMLEKNMRDKREQIEVKSYVNGDLIYYTTLLLQ